MDARGKRFLAQLGISRSEISARFASQDQPEGVGWDYDGFIQKVWEAQKVRDPEGWFLEPPAVALAGTSWDAILERLSRPWRAVLEAHRRRWPKAFATAEWAGGTAVMAVFRPESLLLVPLAAPHSPPSWPPDLGFATRELAYPLTPPRVLSLLRLDAHPPRFELPVNRVWLEAQLAALRFSTCAFPRGLSLASVFDPGSEAEARLARLTFLQAAYEPRLEPELRPANRRLVEALKSSRDILLGLPSSQGPYLLVPMRTGLLFVGRGGDAVPVLLGGARDYRALLARAVPPKWGPLLDLLPFDAEGRPLEDPVPWARSLAQRDGVSEAKLRAWIEEAAHQARSSALGGALVVGKKMSGFVASPVVWRRF